MNLASFTAFACGIFSAEAALPPGYPSRDMRGVSSTVQMPLVGFGTWEYNNTVAEASVLTAMKLGYRAVDTALVYGNHIGVGAALAKSGLLRQDYFVTTKIPGGLNSTATETALDQSLKELGLDHVDLMLLHFPQSFDGKHGGKALRQETWLALEKWAKSGKARAIGVSHYCKSQLDDILAVATVPVALNQNQYHIGMYHDSEDRLHDKKYTQSNGIVYMSYSSLCGPCPPPQNRELITGDLVAGIGRQYNKTGAQVSLRWLVQQNIPVIPKSSIPKHQKANFELFDFNLSANDMARLNAATSPPETGTPESPDDAQDCQAIPDGASRDASLFHV